MRAIIQRVSECAVAIDGKTHAKIGSGLLILLGITHEDSRPDAEWLIRKISAMRLFNDQDGIMNLSVNEVGGELMVISQFTLYASCKKGNRPSYIDAARPEFAEPLYEEFLQMIRDSNPALKIHTGVFGADMKVQLINDGPVTIILDSKEKT